MKNYVFFPSRFSSHHCHSNGLHLNQSAIKYSVHIPMFGHSVLFCGSCFHWAKCHIQAWMPIKVCTSKSRTVIVWRNPNMLHKICKTLIEPNRPTFNQITKLRNRFPFTDTTLCCHAGAQILNRVHYSIT